MERKREVAKAILCGVVLALLPLLGAKQFQIGQRNFSPASSSLYYGPGCAGTSTNTCDVPLTSRSDAGLSSYELGFPITMGSNPAGYTVQAFGGGFVVAAGNMQGGLRDSSGALVCNNSASVAETVSDAWTENTSGVSSCPTLTASTAYVVTVQQSSDTSAISDPGPSVGFYAGGVTFGTWSSSLTLSGGGYSYAIYVRVTAN